MAQPAISEWWAYWVTEGQGEEPTFRGWMYLRAFDAQHVQARMRLGMVLSGETVHLVNAVTGQVAEALVLL